MPRIAVAELTIDQPLRLAPAPFPTRQAQAGNSDRPGRRRNSAASAPAAGGAGYLAWRVGARGRGRVALHLRGVLRERRPQGQPARARAPGGGRQVRDVLARDRSATGVSATLRRRLFGDAEYEPDLDRRRAHRYRAANDNAQRYAAWLEDTFVTRRRNPGDARRAAAVLPARPRREAVDLRARRVNVRYPRRGQAASTVHGPGGSSRTPEMCSDYLLRRAERHDDGRASGQAERQLRARRGAHQHPAGLRLRAGDVGAVDRGDHVADLEVRARGRTLRIDPADLVLVLLRRRVGWLLGEVDAELADRIARLSPAS